MRRISVTGNSGSGKTTLAREIGARLDLPVLELDGIFHQPGWVERDREEFRHEVTAFCAGDGWVVDGNYSAVRDLVWARADTAVWLDLSRLAVSTQVVRRTVRRALTRQELWNGNREPLANLWPGHPDSIIRWSWTHHGKFRRRYLAATADPTLAHLHWVRLRSRAEARTWLATLR